MSTPTVVLPESQNPVWARQTARTVSEMEREHQSDVVLLSVLDRTTVDDPEVVDEHLADRSGIQTAKEELANTELSVSTLGVPSDDQADGIIEGIEQVNADRAYMYGRKRSPAGKAVFGSTLGDVLTRSSVPVIVVPPADG